MATLDLATPGEECNNPFTFLDGEHSAQSAADDQAPHAARDSLQGVSETLTLAQERLLVEVEVLTFLAEILDGGGDPLNLSPDARAGFSIILGGVVASVDSIAGQIGAAK